MSNDKILIDRELAHRLLALIDANLEQVTVAERKSIKSALAASPAALDDEIKHIKEQNMDWLKANSPGGWIDDNRKRIAELEAELLDLRMQEPVAWASTDSLRVLKENEGETILVGNKRKSRTISLYAAAGAQEKK